MITSAIYPPKAAPALGFLKSSYNDIEIFVEDSATPNMWIKLLRVYLPQGVRMESVNILGSKKNVLEACRADQVIDNRKKLYIVDADLDLLRGRPKPKLKHLYRLRAYCVENYLIEEHAFIATATIFDPNIDEITAKKKLNLHAWLDKNRDNLKQLFVCYAVTHELAEQYATVGYKVQRLMVPGNGNFDLCPVKTSIRIIHLYRYIRRQCSKDETRMVFDRIRKNVENIKVEMFVSGKDYIFPSLYALVKHHFGCNININSFKTMIAGNIDTTIDPYLLRRLRVICN